MEAILRIMYPDKIADYDLSVRKEPVQEGAFQAFPDGNTWYGSFFENSGPLHVGDVRVIDPEQEIAILVLEKVTGSPKYLDWKDGLTIGRKEGNDIVLQDGMVSGSHCRVFRREEGWYLQDRGSTNGTYVNDRRIDSVLLREGDVIKLGRYRWTAEARWLKLENADTRVHLHVPALEPSAMELFEAAPYPWFSRAPRLRCGLEPLKISIEDAPSIGSKPGMGIGGIMLSPTMMALSMGNQVLRYGIGTRKYKKLEKRREEIYTQYIANIEAQLKEFTDRQRAYEEALHPTLGECMARVEGPRMNLWERRPGDPDFLTLRLGLGTAPSAAEIKIQQQRLQLYEDALDKIPGQIAEKYAMAEDIPICCDLIRDGNCGIIGSRASAVFLMQSMAAQIAALHSYDEVKMVVLYPQQERTQWEWMRWLPHCQSGSGGIRYLAWGPDAKQVLEEMESILQRRLNGRNHWDSGETADRLPHYVFLIADASALKSASIGQILMRNDPAFGFSGIFLGSSLSDFPNTVQNVVEIQEKSGSMRLLLRTSRGQTEIGGWEHGIPAADYDRFARAMAPIRLNAAAETNALPTTVSFLDGLGISQPDHLDLREYWDNSCNYKSMSVPIGVRANGELFCFDIHEKAHGPHGLVAGMTGSGKSEMVMSWILSMALHFSPQDVSFVLIDFKGTGLILPFMKLPHLAGTISDLDTNISRNLVALNSELDRRKALFDGAGVNKIADYLKLYHSGRVSEPLPYLFVVIDEYAEFKSQFPDFTNQINSLFRTGRSLGIHIMLMTQNPSGVVSGESESNVRFRWCLKVASTAASKEMLGTHNEAAYLTNPGRAYVQVGSDEVFEEIQSFYSGAPYQPDRKRDQEQSFVIYRVASSGARTAICPSGNTRPRGTRAEIDVIVDHIRDYTDRNRIPDARRIWQDRMPEVIHLSELLRQAAREEDGSLLPVVGLVDDPARQIQLPLRLPLSSEGHAAIIGAPGSGKTVFLQTLVVSLCTQYSPEEVNLYLLDFGSWTMGMFRDFPHVCAIANSNEEAGISRIAEAIGRELQYRKECFSREGAGNLRTYLRMTDEAMPYLVLLVDKYESAKTQPGLEDFFLQVSREGGSYGIYLVFTAGSTTAMGFKMEQTVRTKLALQLTNSSDYLSIVGKTGGLLPEKLPGRGLVNNGYVMEFQTALPAAFRDDGSYAMTIRSMGRQLQSRWGSRKNAAMRVMPDIVAYGSVRPQTGGFVLGIGTSDLKPVEISLRKPHYLLVSGLPGSGKTTLLKTLARQMAEQGSRVAVFGGVEECTEPDGAELLRTGAAADAFLEELRGLLAQRQAQRREEPNAAFPPVYLLIDGYRCFFDQVSQQSADRLKALVMAGSGLGVSLIAADTASSLMTLIQYREPVISMLTKGPVILLGGKSTEHLAVNLNLPASEKAAKLKPWEAWYGTGEATVRLKIMNCAEKEDA